MKVHSRINSIQVSDDPDNECMPSIDDNLFCNSNSSCFILVSGLGCLRSVDGVYYYGTFTTHDPYGPGVVIKPIIESSSDNTDGLPKVEPITATSRFQVFPVVCKHDQVQFRWIKKSEIGIEETDSKRKRSDSSQVIHEEEKKSTVSDDTFAAATSSTKDIRDDDEMVWNYTKKLMNDGLRHVIRLHHELAIRGMSFFHSSTTDSTSQSTAASSSSISSQGSSAWTLSESFISSLISSHLADFSDSSSYQLINLPMSIWNSAKKGVCSYRITDEASGPCEAFLCHTCSARKADGEDFEICMVSVEAKQRS